MDAPKSADKARASSDSKVLDPIVALPTASATMAQPSTAGLYDALTPEEEIGADPDSQDDDSMVGQFSAATSLASASSSVYNFVTREDGRRYHAYRAGKYMLPNDEVEQDRLNMQHQLWLMTLHGQLSLAPLKKEPLNVLDLGTGTGIWATDYALEHPTASVVGSDLSPIQPDFIPPNCSFQVEDYEDEWIYSQKFDLIHGRLLVSCLPNPKRVFEHAFNALAPGGYFEMQDGDFPGRCVDGTLNNTALDEWYKGISHGFTAIGRDTGIVKKYKDLMQEVGFVEIEEKIFYWPINTWPKDPHLKRLGFWFRQDLSELVQTLTPSVMKLSGMTPKDIPDFQEEVKRCVLDRKIHAYHIIRVVIGKKPEHQDAITG